MSIGENIRNKRALHKVSQKIVAEAVGVAENTVASWEKGKNLPPADKVIAIAKYFRCTTDEILLGESERDLAPQMMALLKRFSDLPEKRKPLTLSLMASLLATIENEA